MPDLSVNSSPENLPPVGPLGKGHVSKQEEQPQVGSMKGQPERAVIAPLTERTNAPELVTAEKVGQTFPTNIPEEGPTDSPTGPQKNMPDVRVKKPEGHARKSSEKLTKLMKELIGTNTKELSKLQKEMDAVQKKISEKSQKMQEVGAKKQKLEEDSKTAMYASKSREAAKLAYEAEKQQKILSNVQREVEELTNKMRELDQKIKPLEDSQRELFAKKIEGCIGQTDISQLYSLLTKENFVKNNLKLIREKLPEDQRAKFDAVKEWIDLSPKRDVKEVEVMHDLVNLVCKKQEFTWPGGSKIYDFADIEARHRASDDKAYLIANPVIQGHKVLKLFVSSQEEKDRIDQERVFRTIQSYIALMKGNYLTSDNYNACKNITENLKKLSFDENETKNKKIILQHLQSLKEALLTDCCRQSGFDVLVKNLSI